MAYHDPFDWTNAVIGAAGFVLTVGTLFQAIGAKKAAEQARGAVLKREASDSFLELGGLAKSLAELLSLERLTEAAVRARDLVDRIPLDRERFGAHLGADSDKLKEIETVFQNIAIRVSSVRFPEEKGEVDKAVGEVLRVSGELGAINGRLLRSLD
jgi:hypothetical protein